MNNYNVYTPQNWKSKEIINKEGLNHIEYGIKNNSVAIQEARDIIEQEKLGEYFKNHDGEITSAVEEALNDLFINDMFLHAEHTYLATEISSGNYAVPSNCEDNLDNFPKNTCIGLNANLIRLLQPNETDPFYNSNTGVFVETFGLTTPAGSNIGGIQRITNWTGTKIAIRPYVGGNEGWRAWHIYEPGDLSARASGYITSTALYNSLDDLPYNTVFNISGSALNSMSSSSLPDLPLNGCIIETISARPNGSMSGGMQRMTDFAGRLLATRICLSVNDELVWQPWQNCELEKDERVIYVRKNATEVEGQIYKSVIKALRYTMYTSSDGFIIKQYNKLSPYYIIDIGEGEWNLWNDDEYGYLDERNLMQSYTPSPINFYLGMFVMPNVEIRGAGKEKTILKFYHNMTDENISSNDEEYYNPNAIWHKTMQYTSALNVPYNTTIRDLTISVKNIRYCIHKADNFRLGSANQINPELIKNNKLLMKNVRLEHLGFDSEHPKATDSDYRFPCSFGCGNWDGNDQEFINCDFYAAQCPPWLNHDHIENTVDSTFNFTNCTMVYDDAYNNFNGEANGSSRQAACALISWGSTAKIYCNFNNCIVTPNIGLFITPQQDNSPSYTTAYKVITDNNILITESTKYNSHTLDNYCTGNCIKARLVPSPVSTNPPAQISAYEPVSMERTYFIHPYSSNDSIVGIALHNATGGDIITIQTSGFVSLKLLGIRNENNTPENGQYYKYINNEWVIGTKDDSLIKVIDNGYTGMILQPR